MGRQRAVGVGGQLAMGGWRAAGRKQWAEGRGQAVGAGGRQRAGSGQGAGSEAVAMVAGGSGATVF